MDLSVLVIYVILFTLFFGALLYVIFKRISDKKKEKYEDRDN